MRYVICIFFAFVCTIATAKGGSHSGRSISGSSVGARTVWVAPYNRKDGTHVNGYWRSLPGSNLDEPLVYGPNDPLPEDESTSYPISESNSAPRTQGCVFKTVMTDAEIAECKKPIK